LYYSDVEAIQRDFGKATFVIDDPMPPPSSLSPAAPKNAVAKFDVGRLSSDSCVLALREIERRLRVGSSPSEAARQRLMQKTPV
jgi:hypothetical protein